ncbi:uncharacterized protein LOC124655715 [Lolium rigidum]|uniref:uncharacterized protein LOC124655715 n=1 Tax=Lolium rigidum TaxID=89674 RepID=UPI001F5C1137|nr:uncharacterized protein LOC124655715 [Lolium rigidum]
MERKQGGCCLAPRCGGDGGQGQAWQMGNIMLKFRPIAPKPAAMAPAPVTAPAMATAAGARKGKRKAAAAGRRGRKPKKATAVATATATQKADVHKDKPLPSPSSSSSGTTSVADSSSPPPPPPTLMHASSPNKPADLPPAHVAALRPAASCVTVEAVTATWRDGEAPAAPACAGEDDDEEAPAFASDRWGRVTWTNLAFSRAASASDVVLAARDGAAVPAWGACAGFTCRVRVACGASPRRGGSLVAPCDVWRVGDGGYLWRLDLRTTLTLSLGGPRVANHKNTVEEFLDAPSSLPIDLEAKNSAPGDPRPRPATSASRPRARQPAPPAPAAPSTGGRALGRGWSHPGRRRRGPSWSPRPRVAPPPCAWPGLVATVAACPAVRETRERESADLADEYIRSAESTNLESCKKFVIKVCEVFGDKYLRSPNAEDTARLLAIEEERGFPDGIYPQWATFVKTIPAPDTQKKKKFAQMQEAAAPSQPPPSPHLGRLHRPISAAPVAPSRLRRPGPYIQRRRRPHLACAAPARALLPAPPPSPA